MLGMLKNVDANGQVYF